MPARPDSRGLLAPILLVLLGIGFLGFIAWLLDTRVGGGDIYPPYSTLRADPRGCKAIFLTVEAMPGREAQRNFRKWHRLRLDQPCTLFVPGGALAVHDFPANEQKAIRAMLEAGQRIVLTVPTEAGFSEWLDEVVNDPRAGKDNKPSTDKDRRADKPKPADPAGSDDDDPDLHVLAGLKIAAANRPTDAPPLDILSERFPGGHWRGAYHFTLPADNTAWAVDGRAGDQPVIVSRRIGAGELVVVADTSFATNGIVWSDRQSTFLMALLGDRGRVVFDERSLGTTEDPGVVTLVRQLGLHGLVLGALVLLVLLAWHGLCPLVPPDPEREAGLNADGTTSGRDASDGLVALLQRGLPGARLLGEGIDRWLQTRGHGPAIAPDTVNHARALAAAARPSRLARTYLEIHKLLNPPK